ncbi:MAG: PAS domain S-box protein [Leptolyngbyaceae cyanobacterium bins.349]|nr:PAS domain S-box protein [Leptolyngbyaceae cyanobacterium bins.349]
MLHSHFLNPVFRPANQLQYSTFASVPYAMIATDNQGTIQAFNPAAEKLLGYSAKEVIGRLTPVVFHDPTELRQAFNYQRTKEYHLFQPGVEVLVSKARQGIIQEQEWTYLNKSGDRLLVWLSVAPLQDEHQTLLGFLFIARDITAQRHAEIAAKRTELHFRRMVGNVPGMIYQQVYRQDGSSYFPFVGYNCFSIFEVEPKEIQKNASILWEMVHPDDLLTFKITSTLSAQQLQTCETELEVTTPSGCIKWIQTIARPTLQPNGDVIWDGVMIDISDRKKLEAERDRFFNLPLDILGVIHANGVFRQVNTAVTEILGYSIPEFQAQSFLELIHPEDQAQTSQAFERLCQGTTQFFENRCRCRDGTYKWLSWKAVAVPEENLFYAIGRDVTDKKAAETASHQLNHELEIRVQAHTAELKKAYQELSFLIENFQLAVIEWNADFQVQRWSPEAEKLFGWGTRNVVGKSPLDWNFVHEEDHAIANETIQALLNGTQTRGMYSIRNYTREQKIVHCDWFHSALVDESGKLVSVLSLVLDATERKQAEEELKASQHRFATAFHRSPAALSITSFPEGMQLDVNEGWVQSTGYTREEAIGKKSRDLKFWQFETEQEEFIRQLREQGSVRNMLIHSRIKGGEIRKILLSSDLIELEGKSCLLNSAIDITEQKQVEELLTQQLAAIEASADGIAILDANERYTYLNKAHAELFGFQNVQDLLGRTWRELYDASEIQRFEQDVFPVFLQQGAWRGEAIAQKRDGSPLPQDVTLTRLENGGLTCICRDITERKAFEAELQRSYDDLENRVQERTEALRNANSYLHEQMALREALTKELAQSEDAFRQSEARLQAFLGHAEAVISLKDIEGRYLLVNQKFLNTYNLTQDQVIGKTAKDLFSDAQVQLIESTDQKVIRTGMSIEYERLIPLEQTSLTYLSLKFPLIDSQGTPYAIGCISTDITARKQVEDKVIQALEREKELGELKTRFITNTSHEFRTPLTTILGSAELLDANRQKLTPEKMIKHCDRIKLAVKHMTRLLDDVLIISKAEAGKLPFAPEDFNLTAFCSNLVEDLQAGIINQTTIHFSSPTQPIIGKFDQKLLRQVLENLISNAVKYSPPGSTVLFELSTTPDTITFRVQDSGIGIPQADIPHLFEPFQRASNVGTISGTGLGLSIVSKAVELHRGRITIESHEGQGSLFTVTIPRSV